MTPERACALVACGFPPGARPNPPGARAVYAAQTPGRLLEAILPHVVLRGVPDRLHRELKTAAARNCRSLNGEILARLTASVQVQAEPVDVETLLERIRQRRGRIGPVDLGAAALREMKDAGRP